MNVRFDCTGRVALVTAGTSGIGAAATRAFLAAGAHVVACRATAARRRRYYY